MQTSFARPVGLSLALTVACSAPAAPAASPDTTAAGDAATSFGDTALDSAAADSAAKDAVGSDTAAADTAVAEVAAADGAGPDAPGGDMATADAKPADASAPTDAAATELPGGDVGGSDSGPVDASGGEVSKTDVSSTDVTKDVPSPQPLGKIGACRAGAPGYGSCFSQAFVLCLQPGATCKAVSEFSPAADTFTTTWSNSSVLACVTTISGTEGTITCTGHGPDGKACLQYTQKFKDEMPAGTMVTGPNGSHSLAYDASFKVTVTCGDGSKEGYAKSEDLCYPLQSGVCEENIGGGG